MHEGREKERGSWDAAPSGWRCSQGSATPPAGSHGSRWTPCSWGRQSWWCYTCPAASGVCFQGERQVLEGSLARRCCCSATCNAVNCLAARCGCALKVHRHTNSSAASAKYARRAAHTVCGVHGFLGLNTAQQWCVHFQDPPKQSYPQEELTAGSEILPKALPRFSCRSMAEPSSAIWPPSGASCDARKGWQTQHFACRRVQTVEPGVPDSGRPE
jgi:hypothetical protein